MKTPPFLVIFLLSLVSFSSWGANECSEESQRYADFWGNSYTPEEALAFGKKIQQVVSNKDVSGFFSLIQGELQKGPRKAFVANKSFEEVFEKEWIENVLSSSAPCGPVGWRGFTLSNGLIWYDKYENGWAIFAINGVIEETIDSPSIGWSINNKIVRPDCFKRPWPSGDNFEEFSEVFGITNSEQLFEEPGLFLGDVIANFDPIKPSWCAKDDECRSISLVGQLNQCSVEDFNFEARDGGVWTKDSTDSGIESTYKILGTISDSRCAELAPHIGVRCKKSYLLSVGDHYDDTGGADTSFGIYGLFDLPNDGLSIVPLKFFSNKNEGLNFRDNSR